ncbi:hypothetical protein KHA94_05720 [Bacillus sp. FJAT-49705]|uniref:Uncharacterized protein n=1 Tax=Cytobacillus citreus TaxID=2833586 RepID=A0ABS5NPH8_9BACI|nr:hypothetical protein [Cytobacillus citreus]MBS4189705.1 hypothetical protein [Cytobacillus citreus]
MKSLEWMFKTKHRRSELLAVSFAYFFALFLPNYLGLDKVSSLILVICILIMMRIIEWPLAKFLGQKDKKVEFKYYIYMFLLVPFLVIALRMFVI